MSETMTLRDRAIAAHEAAVERKEQSDREAAAQEKKRMAQKLKQEVKNLLRMDVNPSSGSIVIEDIKFEICDNVLRAAATCSWCVKAENYTERPIHSLEDLGEWLSKLEKIHEDHGEQKAGK